LKGQKQANSANIMKTPASLSLFSACMLIMNYLQYVRFYILFCTYQI